MKLRRSLRSPLVTFGALGAALGAAGCYDTGTPAEQPALESAAIVNGVVSDPSDDGVVRLGRKGGAACTASAIAPNVILTALHCVATVKQDSGFVCNPDGTIDPSAPTDGMLGGTLNAPDFEVRVGVEYHSKPDAHGKKLFGTGSTNICSNDLALMILDTDLDVPLVPLRFGKSIARGERVRSVGYGQTTMDGTSQRFARADRLVLDVGADLLSPGSKTAAPRTFVIGEGPCHGDSGGPALSEETNAVLGVYSILNASNCVTPGARNVYTQAAPFETLIRKVLTEAGHEPVLESEPVGGGEGGATGTDAGGAPGTAGAGNEPTEVGGTGGASDGAGGSTVSAGGSGAVGGSDTGTGGSGAIGSAGEETGTTTGASGSNGSGSRRDSSCACRTVPEPARQAPLGTLGGLFAALGLVIRRRQRA